MTGVSEVEQGPPWGMRVGFANLKQGLFDLRVLRIRQGEFVDGMLDSLVPDRPT